MKYSLHVVSDAVQYGMHVEDALAASAFGGADVLQIREKRAPAHEVYQRILKVRALCAETPGGAPRIIVNDRVDVAMAAHADGVHLAAKSLPVAVVAALRAQCHWNGVIGCSVHSLQEAQQAADAGADYVTFGHIFDTLSHPGQPPRGLEALARIVEAVDIPVIAIGGIDAGNLSRVVATGCSGIAVIGAVLHQPDARLAAASLRAILDASDTVPRRQFVGTKGGAS